VVGLAGVKRIPLSLRLHALLYSNPQYLTPLSCRRLLADGTQKTLCSQYCGKTKQTCRNVCIWSGGEFNGWQVSRHKPLDTTSGPGPPQYRGFTITLRHSTFGRTPLDESSARRRDLYLATTHNTQETHPCSRLDSNLQSQQVYGHRPTP